MLSRGRGKFDNIDMLGVQINLLNAPLQLSDWHSENYCWSC